LTAPLERTLAGGRVSSAYLLEGPDLATLDAAARALTAALLCPERTLGCGCAVCGRVRAGVHADVTRLVRDKATVISVEALEPVLARAHQRPFEAARQVIVVVGAEALEPAGFARYLKTLEEPPESTVFLLLTTRPERLPDTVRSRCRRLAFPPFEERDVVARLLGAGVAPEAAARAARYASGSPERARRMADGEIAERLGDLWTSARAAEPDAARAVDGVLAALESVAATRAAARESESLAGSGDLKREALRAALGDLLHALAVEGRDAAAGRPAFGGVTLDPRAGLDLLEQSAALAAAVAQNVTPAAVLHAAWAALKRASASASAPCS
jgi:DNA polymerase-3 subunit delta'